MRKTGTSDWPAPGLESKHHLMRAESGTRARAFVTGPESGWPISAARRRKRQIFNDLMRVLALVLDFDEGTKLFHAFRVAVLARTLGRALDLDADLLFHAGLVHDLGGIGMSDHVVHHARTGFERAEARTHAARGARILRPLTALQALASVVAHHHERWDGGGFPEGLSGTAVPLGSSVICFADLLEIVLRDAAPEQRRERALRLALHVRGTACAPEVAEAALGVLARQPALLDELFDDAALESTVRSVEAEPAALLRMTEEELLAQLLWVLARVVDTKHAHTMGHSARVAFHARQIAARLGGAVDPWDVVWAALLHDLGMVAVPRAVVAAAAPLGEHERASVNAHPRHTRELVGSVACLSHLAHAASAHHEAWDGSGYPDGLAGESIPLVARIIAYADVYDALSSDRPDRRALSHEDALAAVRERIGTQLDPNLADAALRGLGAPRDVHSASSDLLGFQQFFESDDADLERVLGPRPPPGELAAGARWHTVLLGASGGVRSGGAALRELTGVSSPALAEHLAPGGRDRLEEELARAFGGETVASAHRTASGATLELVVGPLDDGLVAHVRRASPAWRSMRELALVHKNFLVSSEAVCFTDAEAHIVDVNSAFTRLFGWRADEVIGKTPRLLQSGQHPESLYREMRESLADPQVGAWSGELVDRTRSGELVVVHLTISALRDPSGRVVGFVSNALDVTARRRAQEALEQRERELLRKNEELSRLSQFKSQMVAITSHDLRAPLASMIAVAELLQEAGEPLDSDRSRARLGMIADAGHRLVRLVNDLLDLDKCEDGTLKLRPRPLSPLGLVGAVATAVSLEQRRTILVAPGEDRALVGDADRLEQALLNLVRNAVRFSPEPASVEVGCDVGDPERVVLWVADRGPGIPDELLGAVFDRYVQVDREGAIEAHGIGAGLGLAIVRHVAELHGGRAAAENRSGGGCRFTLDLPARRVPAPLSALLLGPAGDDLDRAARVFSRGGLTVLHAAREDEAARRLAVEAPALILVDARWAGRRLDARIAETRGRSRGRIIALLDHDPIERDERFDWELVTPLMDLELASVLRLALARAREVAA